MIAPPKIVGMPSAITVTTGIRLLRSTWTSTTDPLAHALGAGGAHVVLAEVVEHRGAHEAADLRGVEEREHRDRHDHLLDLQPEGLDGR